jgi:hypothetical protein
VVINDEELMKKRSKRHEDKGCRMRGGRRVFLLLK